MNALLWWQDLMEKASTKFVTISPGLFVFHQASDQSNVDILCQSHTVAHDVEPQKGV